MTEEAEAAFVAAERVQQLLADRNDLIRQQVVATTGLAGQVTALRMELGERPTRAEINRTRRRLWVRQSAVLIAVMLVTAYLAIWAHESYRDRCDVPGAAPPGWCGYVFPNHPDHTTMSGERP